MKTRTPLWLSVALGASSLVTACGGAEKSSSASDSDGDGFSNRFELACATDPGNASSMPNADTLLGEGTSKAPFVICLPGHFDLLAARPDVAAAHATITWDLDFEKRAPPRPLGTTLAPFTGTLSGHGHKLRNLDFALATKVQAGLVEALGAGGLLEDLKIDAVHGAAGSVVVGSNAGTLRRVTAVADTAASDHVGILVNVNQASGSIEDCHTHGTIRATKSFVGGLVGENLGSVADSSSTAEVHGENRSGGLVGSTTGTVVRSFATGAVSGTKTFIGGLVGTVRNGGRVSDCYALGNVTALTFTAGGLVGSGENVATLERSYAKNTVTAPSPHGVLGVDSGNTTTVTDCYFAKTWTANDDLATGLDDGALIDQDSYQGFDFTAGTGVWKLASEVQATPSLVAH